MQGSDEQGPAILQVGDHSHAQDAENELAPALSVAIHVAI